MINNLISYKIVRYLQPLMIDYTEIKTLLRYPKNIVILGHRNPDGDALGSCLGLKYYLDQLGHASKVIMPSEYPSTFKFMKGIEDILVYDLKQEDTLESIRKSDIIFTLDFNGLDRVEKMAKTIQESKATKILIDHHLDPEPFADHVLSETSASSTCELVFKFIDGLGDAQKLNLVIAELLFVGLITDTGSFKYNTRPYTYRVAAELKERGVDDYFIQDKIFNSMTSKQVMLLGHCLANRLELVPEYKTGIIALTKEDYIKWKIGRGDTEGVVNYILMIKGIEVAAFIREQPTIVKLSLRSKGDISVQDIARKYFKGGGHKNASGGAAYAKLSDVVAKFKKALPEYIKPVEVLTN